MSERGTINIVFIGHVDHGKSTLIGRTLYESGVISKRKMEEYEEKSKKLGKGSFKFAWIMDTGEEKARGLTIDIEHAEFKTKKNRFTIVDAPGHRDFVKNMIMGVSEADAAVLVVAADDGVMPQTYEHAVLARTIGSINQLLVVINKMDAVKYKRERYEELVHQISNKVLRPIGYDMAKISFVPVSAFHGDNVTRKSENMKWYDGPTFLEALDTFEPPKKPLEKPLRIPIDEIHSIKGVGTVVCGKVETGVLKVDDELILRPSDTKGVAKDIEVFHRKVPKAEAGDNIGFNIRGVNRKDVKIGDVASHVKFPSTVAEEILARIFVIYHPTTIRTGYTPVLHAHVSHAPARIIEIVQKYDPISGEILEQNPKYIRKGDNALVRIQLLKPIVLEKASDLLQLGRFALRDMGTTIAAGIVAEVTRPVQVS